MTARRDRLHLLGACVLLVLGIWANSGTLTPIASTLANPVVTEPCQYLLNIDHYHFKAVFWMLDGAPREQWDYSVVLRRLLHPLLAYPLMKLLGFAAGGILLNVLLAVGSVAFFWITLRRRYGEDLPHAGLWLLATYPGFFYWAGLPYSYGAIVPVSLLGLTVLWRLAEARDPGWREALLCGLLLGLFATAYDLLPFFGPAGLLVLLHRRRVLACAPFVAGLVAAPLAVLAFLKLVLRVPLVNANTEVYGIIVRTYLSAWKLSPAETAQWGALLKAFPKIALDVYLYSNFLFLPLLFLLCLLVTARLPRGERSPGPAEIALLAAAVALFLFNNLAPAYPGWQLRGSWIARLYQPSCAAMIAWVAVACGRSRLLRGAVLLTIVLDSWIVFAPVLGSTGLSQFVYHRFYRHAPPTAYSETLARFGARPIGFCRSGPVPSAPSAAATVTH
jgi:hypothetical protein